jgi:hypothetical protein
MGKGVVLLAALMLAAVVVCPAFGDVTYDSDAMVGWTWDYYDTVEPIGASYDNVTNPGWLTIHLPEDGAGDSNLFSNNPILYRTGLGIDDAVTSYDVITHMDCVDGGGRMAAVMIFDQRGDQIMAGEQDGSWLTYFSFWGVGTLGVRIFPPTVPGDVTGQDYLKIHVEGNVITMFSSPDGSDWTQRGDPLDMTGTWFDTATNSTLKLGVTNICWDNWEENRDASFDYVTVSTGVIPEPSVFLLSGTGLLGLLAARRRK